MKYLPQLLKILESKPDVDAVFITGSGGVGTAGKSSDLDIVIILTENKTNIRSVFQKIDGVFADIYFFDKNELQNLLSAIEVKGSSFDGMLLSWITKSEIKFDKSQLLTGLKARIADVRLIITEDEVNKTLSGISYNFFQNRRYFNSETEEYREALEIRLMYSVSDLIVGFLTLRNEPWRGEKQAIRFTKERSPDFYALFTEYNQAHNLEERMKIYEKMVLEVLPQGMKLFDYNTPLALPKDGYVAQEIERQSHFWDDLTGQTTN